MKSYSNLVSKSISGYTLLDTVIASNLLNVTSEAGYIDFTVCYHFQGTLIVLVGLGNDCSA